MLKVNVGSDLESGIFGGSGSFTVFAFCWTYVVVEGRFGTDPSWWLPESRAVDS